jgi:hypothetical protein
LPLLTRTYLLPLLMHPSVQSLSELSSAWAARIFAWLAPHALSEIFPVHVAPKQDVASKAIAKVILEIILEHSRTLDQREGKVCPLNKATHGTLWTRPTIRVKQPETEHSVSVDKLQTWLAGGGESPHEQVLKRRLSELL